MRTLKFKLLILIAIIVSTGKLAEAQRTSKRVYHNYAVERVSKLQVDNKYGNIFINDMRTDSVIVDVDVWVEGLAKEKADQLLNQINISVRLSGKTLIVQTSISPDFNTRQNFSIDYHIYIPADRDLAINQKYGNVIMNDLTGKGEFEIKYGTLTGKRLNSPTLTMNIEYGKVDIEEMLDLTAELRYSKFFFEKGNSLNINSRYSTFDTGECESVIMESRYDDLDIESIGSLQLESKYTTTKIGTLYKNLIFTNGYGNFKINNVPAGFESIKVENRYASVNIGIEYAASYYLKGNVDYCKLKHPDSNELNKFKENTSYEVEGYVGPERDTSSKVTIESKYGSVSLVK